MNSEREKFTNMSINYQQICVCVQAYINIQKDAYDHIDIIMYVKVIEKFFLMS